MFNSSVDSQAGETANIKQDLGDTHAASDKDAGRPSAEAHDMPSNGSAHQQTEQAPDQISDSDLEKVARSLPVYIPQNGENSSVTATSYEMVAIQYQDGLKPAIVMNKELVDAIITALDTDLEAIYHQNVLNAKDDHLDNYLDWNYSQQQKLTSRIRKLERSRQAGLRERQTYHKLGDLEEKDQEARRHMAMVQQTVEETNRHALMENHRVNSHLQNLFDHHGLMDPETDHRNEVKLEESFLEDWKIPEAQEDSESDDSWSSGSRSPPGPRNQFYRPSPEPQDRRKPPASPTPTENAKDFLYSARRRFYFLQRTFEREQEHKPPVYKEHPDETSSAADRRMLKYFMESTRELIDTEEQFRAAKKACNELGGKITFDDQTSCFPDSENDEEAVRESLQQFAGPESQPRIPAWLEDVDRNFNFVDTVMDSRTYIEVTPPSDIDEWNAGPELAPWDCYSQLGEGREKVRIEAVKKTQRELRAAFEGQAEVEVVVDEEMNDEVKVAQVDASPSKRKRDDESDEEEDAEEGDDSIAQRVKRRRA